MEIAPQSRRKLLETGKTLLRRQGVSGLGVRDLCRKAEVNPGLFHYYFQTKENFVRELIQEIYDLFFRSLHFEYQRTQSPDKRLEALLEVIGRFARDNRALLLVLLSDAACGEKNVVRVFSEQFPRHVQLLMQTIEEVLANAPKPKPSKFVALSFVMGAVVWPCLFSEIISRSPRLVQRFAAAPVLQRELLSDKAIRARALLAARALHTRRET